MRCERCNLDNINRSTVIELIEGGWRVTSRCPQCGLYLTYERRFEDGSRYIHTPADTTGNDVNTTGHTERSDEQAEQTDRVQGAKDTPDTRGDQAGTVEGRTETQDAGHNDGLNNATTTNMDTESTTTTTDT